MLTDDLYKEAYIQAFESARHYSILRYTVLTVFIAITGSLIKSRYEEKFKDQPRPVFLMAASGLLTTAMFGLFQWRISELLYFYMDQTKNIGIENLHLSVSAASLQPSTGLGRSITIWFLGIFHTAIMFFWLRLSIRLSPSVYQTIKTAKGAIVSDRIIISFCLIVLGAICVLGACLVDANKSAWYKAFAVGYGLFVGIAGMLILYLELKQPKI